MPLSGSVSPASLAPSRVWFAAALGLLGLSAAALPATAANPAPIDFSRQVRPILSDACFHCHGPDEAGRKARLRLDTFEGATRDKGGLAAIVPGHSLDSELIARVLSTDPEEAMPPPESKRARLTPEHIAILKQWIDEGASYQPHWAFQPLAPVAAPEGRAEASPIDRFVVAGLARRGLSLQPEADRDALLRRITFDLTGLPPTPAELAAFRNDSAPDALERTVDRLLASPRFGERMATDWLDLARYADSFGFQVDRDREMWPWRDWVIRAFNQNLPWDQFVTWQLAGDLLPGATDDQILATAFNRLHPQESEGGSVEEEYRVNYVNDRVATFGTAFLGLTLDCARCHDHKYDPISQREYYSLAAFFQNIDEAGLYSYFTRAVPTPTMWLQDASHRERYQAATDAVARAESALAALRESRRGAFLAWAKDPKADRGLLVGEIARFDFESREPATPAPVKDKTARRASTEPRIGDEVPDEEPFADITSRLTGAVSFANALAPGQPATSAKENESVPGRSGLGLQLTGDHPLDTRVGNFRRHDPFTLSLWLQIPDTKERAVVLHRSRAWTDAGSRGYELLIEDGRLKWSLIHFWPGNAASIRATAPLPTGRWVHVTVRNDGSSRAAGLSLFVDGEPVAVDIIRDGLTKDIRGGGGDSLAVGERFRDRGLKGGSVDDLRVFNRALTDLEVRELHQPGAAAGASDDAWFATYLALHDGPFQARLAALHEARAHRNRVAVEAREIMVMRELPEPKPAYVLRRGEYNLPGERVTAATPAALPPFPADAPRNRLGLARWLTAPDHPLLARVTVNRFWQSLFGRGLVFTSDDFGNQSERAEYPELLDWLAGEFVRSGWDVKALWRTIVLSQTYRQRSFADPTLMADDPANLWLARGPRHRLPAEMIRDHALAASGLLVERVGGAPVSTYDLPESFKPAPAGRGEDLYRRSLYTFWRRNGPGPVLEAFDTPKRVVCVARRDTTNTPLHALVLLNGVQFVEAARVLAERLLQESGGTGEAFLRTAFARLSGRAADPKEQEILGRMYAEQQQHYRQRPDDALALVALGDTPRNPATDPVVLAAATTVVNALMNHDTFVVKR